MDIILIFISASDAFIVRINKINCKGVIATTNRRPTKLYFTEEGTVKNIRDITKKKKRGRWSHKGYDFGI